MLARNIPYFQRSPVESPGPEEHFGSGAHHVSTLTGEPAAGQYPLGIGGIPTLEKTQEGAGSGPKGTQLAMAATAVPPTSKFRDSSWCMPTDQGPGLIPGPPPPHPGSEGLAHSSCPGKGCYRLGPCSGFIRSLLAQFR